MKRTTGRKLQAMRAQILRDNPLCVHCQGKGLTVLVQEVDHTTALVNGGADCIENMQGLCTPCHVAKTRTDLGLGPVAQFDENGRIQW